jgi:hypothetical protein
MSNVGNLRCLEDLLCAHPLHFFALVLLGDLRPGCRLMHGWYGWYGWHGNGLHSDLDVARSVYARTLHCSLLVVAWGDFSRMRALAVVDYLSARDDHDGDRQDLLGKVWLTDVE